MLKTEFLEQLRAGLAGLPQEDIDGRVAFYSEMIDDRMEEGLSEEEAVAGAGKISDIVTETLNDIPLKKIVKENMAIKRSRSGWEIALLILGFPLWFPLLVAAVAILFSLYIVLWSLVITLWAIEMSFWACALAGLVMAVFYGIKGDLLPCLALLGLGLFAAGLSILLFFGCVAASKGMIPLTKTILRGFKKLFIRKERSK
ncbi:MAG: DUF1700 domain-containing protein [Clostridia bacterium]|nr:DUF1700 domain-containing protein [Clostridia bacterium]